MTEHNRTWSERVAESDPDTVDITTEEDHDHYWDYPDEW